MIPTRIGQKYAGGYYTGLLRIKGAIYSLVVSPAEYVSYTPFSLSKPLVTRTINDGVTNTRLLEDPDFVAAAYCRSLAIDGYADWYLPSIEELVVCYINLKPCSTDINCDQLATELELTSVLPASNKYVTDATIVTDFVENSPQNIHRVVWCSTEHQKSYWPLAVVFHTGSIIVDSLARYSDYVRAFRRELVAGVEA